MQNICLYEANVSIFTYMLFLLSVHLINYGSFRNTMIYISSHKIEGGGSQSSQLEPTCLQVARPCVVVTVVVASDPGPPVVVEAVVGPAVVEAVVGPAVVEAVVGPAVVEAVVGPAVVEAAVDPAVEVVEAGGQRRKFARPPARWPDVGLGKPRNLEPQTQTGTNSSPRISALEAFWSCKRKIRNFGSKWVKSRVKSQKPSNYQFAAMKIQAVGYC